MLYSAGVEVFVGQSLTEEYMTLQELEIRISSALSGKIEGRWSEADGGSPANQGLDHYFPLYIVSVLTSQYFPLNVCSLYVVQSLLIKYGTNKYSSNIVQTNKVQI